MDDLAQGIEEATRALRDAYRVLVFAGSGLSAESGIPTFRGAGGLYGDPELARMVRVETFEGEDRAAQLAWYQERREAMMAAEPNPGHLALARMARRAGHWTVATQNVDHLLEAACQREGSTPEIFHLHGSLLLIRCHDCGHSFEDEGYDLRSQMPCPECEGRLRPGVVWFGEGLPEAAILEAHEAARRCEVCLVVGTSGLVFPASHLPISAREVGALLVEVNVADSELTSLCQVKLRGPAGSILPMLEAALR